MCLNTEKHLRAAQNALNVILSTPAIAEFLYENDRKALAQVAAASSPTCDCPECWKGRDADDRI